MALGYHEESRMILWSRDYMLSCDKEKALYLQYRSPYGHQIWQVSGLKAINPLNASVALI